MSSGFCSPLFHPRCFASTICTQQCGAEDSQRRPLSVSACRTFNRMWWCNRCHIKAVNEQMCCRMNQTLHDGSVIQQSGHFRSSRSSSGCNGRRCVFPWQLRCYLHYCILSYIFVSRKNEGLLLFRSDAVRTCRPIKRSIFLSLRETWMFGVGASCFQQRVMASDFHSSFFTLTMRG